MSCMELRVLTAPAFDRDMPWGNDVPEWLPKFTKKYYAVCQLFATTALLAQGSQMLDGAFSIMFPIQISTFLMTLVSLRIMCAIGLLSVHDNLNASTTLTNPSLSSHHNPQTRARLQKHAKRSEVQCAQAPSPRI